MSVHRKRKPNLNSKRYHPRLLLQPTKQQAKGKKAAQAAFFLSIPTFAIPVHACLANSQEHKVAGPDHGTPAGSTISMANDLILFAEALRNGKIIRRKTLAEMVSQDPKIQESMVIATPFPTTLSKVVT